MRELDTRAEPTKLVIEPGSGEIMRLLQKVSRSIRITDCTQVASLFLKRTPPHLGVFERSSSVKQLVGIATPTFPPIEFEPMLKAEDVVQCQLSLDRFPGVCATTCNIEDIPHSLETILLSLWVGRYPAKVDVGHENLSGLPKIAFRRPVLSGRSGEAMKPNQLFDRPAQVQHEFVRRDHCDHGNSSVFEALPQPELEPARLPTYDRVMTALGKRTTKTVDFNAGGR